MKGSENNYITMMSFSNDQSKGNVTLTNNNSKDRTSVSFDEFGKIRLLSQAEFELSEKLKNECKSFGDKIGQFNGIVDSFITNLAGKAEEIKHYQLEVFI